jgi:predicted nucleic acid-binding protein
MQLFQEWSIEDNIRLQEAIRIVQNYHNNIKDEHLFATSGWCLGWLKSLRPQNTWKPSDEQIEILDMVLTNESMDDNIARILRELREQLKKLKGGISYGRNKVFM